MSPVPIAADLEIARIDVYQVDLGYSGGVYRLSGGRELRSFDATIVRITTQTEIEGWGESTPFGSTYIAAHALGIRAAIAELAPHLIGLDPRRVDRVNDAMDAHLVGHESAKSALDLACWDIFGKSVGLPVCELLGGRTDVKLPIICSLSAGTPQEIKDEVAKFRSRGYTCFSVKVAASQDPGLDVERVEAALKDRRPGDFFVVDANGGMTVEGALRMLKLMPPTLDFVLEQPSSKAVPIVFDELALNDASLIQMIKDDVAEGVSIKIAKSGGLAKARRARDICIAAGYTMCVMESAGSDIAFAAVVHLGQTVPRRLLHCVFECREMSTGKIADGDYTHSGGFIQAPKTAELGVTPPEDLQRVVFDSQKYSLYPKDAQAYRLLTFLSYVATGQQDILLTQTPQQRRANAQFAKNEEAKRGKPQSALKKKVENKVEKLPVSKGWLYLLLFVVCGGIVFELVRIVFGAGQGWFSG
ncbi:hypothetical protein LTS10_011387 [Elasticomyces elasticus]|nr:hypothetical protein LTS10_011387 [Elasticomyces elasticus]